MRRTLLLALFAVLGCLVAWRAYAEKYANCFPIGAGACVRVVIPTDTTLPASCVVGDLASKTTTGAPCTTGPCICICATANTWTCK